MNNSTQKFLNYLKYSTITISKEVSNLDVLIFAFRKTEGNPKILVGKDMNSIESEDSMLELSLDTYPRVCEYRDAKISMEESLKIKKWIASNLDVLLDYWNYKISFNQLCKKLKKYEDSMPDPTPPVRTTMDIKDMSDEDKKTMCYSKKAFKTLLSARKSAKKCKVKYNVDFYIYMCPLCGEYHFTAHKWDGVLYL